MKKAVIALFSAVSLFAANYQMSPAKNMKIDGNLDEAAWASAKKIENFTLTKFTATKGGTPAEKTEAKILVDSDAVYFGITCFGLDELRDDLKGEASNPWTNDLVEIFLAPTASKDEYYQFALSAGGAYWSQYFAEAGNIKPDPYKPGFDFATGRTNDAWTVEVRFPFNAFYMTSASKMTDKWAINIARYSMSKKTHSATQNSTWAELNSSFHEIKSFNTVSTFPPKPAKFDLCIPMVTFTTKGRADSEIIGTLNTVVEVESAPAGKYTLETCGQTIEATLKKGSNNITINTSFDKDGRVPVKLILKDSKGEIVCDRKYPVIIDATAYAISFTSPQYGGHFYPGEDATMLKGCVNVNTSEKQVAFTVSGKQYTLPVVDGKAQFSIDVADLKGDISVSVGDISTTVKHISDARAWIRDGKIIIGATGKPQYQLGWYGGIGWITSVAVVEKYPTIASKHPLTMPRGWDTLDPARLVSWNVEKEEIVYDRYPSERVLEATKKAIAKFKSSDNIIYYLSDEPECRGLSPVYLKHLYKYIKSLDPTKLVMIISREPVRFIDCCDVVNMHPYISPSVTESGKRIYGYTIPRLRDIVASVEKQNRPDKAIFLTPQVHSYSFNDIYADYPTFDETVVSIWASVIHGGQGVTPYIWYDHMSRPGVNNACDYLYNTLSHLNEMLTCADQRRLPGDDGRVFINGNKKLYAICNVYNEPRSFSFEAKEKKLYRFCSDEIVKPKKGKVELKLKPYEVYLLTSEEMDEGLAKEADIRAKVAKEEYERSHRGNILFGKGRTVELNYPESRPYTRIRPMEQQDKMFDGNIYVDAWEPKGLTENAWYEMMFAGDVPEFTKARIYGVYHQDLKFKIWKFGKWIEPECKRTANGKYELILEFPKQLRTVKVRLEFSRKDIELYEFELLK